MRPPLVDRDGPWFRSLDGALALLARGASGRRARRLHRCRVRRRRLGRGRRARLLDDAGFDRPIYTNVHDAVPRRSRPTFPTTTRRAATARRSRCPTSGRDRRVVLHVGARRERAARVGERPRGRHRARTRASKPSSTSPSTCGSARATCSPPMVVRWSDASLRRGPGPVVARRHPPRGVPLQHAAHVPRRRARDRVARTPTARPARSTCEVGVGFDEAQRTDGWVVAGAARDDARHARVTAAEFRGPVPPSRATYRFGGHTVRLHARDRRRRAVVGRGTRPLPAAWSRCSTPTATVHDTATCTVGFRRDRDPRPRVAGQRRAGAAPRRQPPRLRSRHRAGRDASSRCAPTSC